MEKLAEKRDLDWPKLDDLVVEPEVFFEKSRISNKDIPSIWKSYLATKEEDLLNLIIKHNKSDLIRELYLLAHYSTLENILKEK